MQLQVVFKYLLLEISYFSFDEIRLFLTRIWFLFSLIFFVLRLKITGFVGTTLLRMMVFILVSLRPLIKGISFRVSSPKSLSSFTDDNEFEPRLLLVGWGRYNNTF
jgi:hypothetical protein